MTLTFTDDDGTQSTLIVTDEKAKAIVRRIWRELGGDQKPERPAMTIAGIVAAKRAEIEAARRMTPASGDMIDTLATWIVELRAELSARRAELVDLRRQAKEDQPPNESDWESAMRGGDRGR